MTPEEEARNQLVTDLCRAAEESETWGEFFAAAAKEIVSLADQLDFRMSDVLATALVYTLSETLKRETGYEAAFGPVIVNNDGFHFVVTDGRHDGFSWHVAGKRERRDLNAQIDESLLGIKADADPSDSPA